jgi:hypothetical protein
VGECGERVQERERRISTVVMSEGDWEGGRREAVRRVFICDFLFY